jgi:hypothetical protein
MHPFVTLFVASLGCGAPAHPIPDGSQPHAPTPVETAEPVPSASATAPSNPALSNPAAPIATAQRDLSVPSTGRYSNCCGGEDRGSKCVVRARQQIAAKPLSVGPAYVFTDAPQRAQTSAFAGGGIGGEFSPDGKNLLYVGAGKGAHLTAAGKVGRGIIESSFFARDGKHVALLSEEGELQVIRVPSGRTVRIVRHGRDPFFPNDREVVFRIGCQAMRASLTSDAPPVPLGPPACGDTIAWDPQLESRVIVTKSNLEFGTSVGYSTISRVSLRSGEWRSLFPYGADLYYRSMRTSRNGQVCAVQVDQNAQRLTCRGTSDSKSEVLWRGHTELIHDFDESGRFVLFSAVHQERMQLLVGDLTTHEARSAGEDQNLDWRFLGGGANRIVGFGGKQAFALDFAQGVRFTIGTPKEQWEGFTRVPGDPSRFLLGRERGAGRDLFWVRLPAWARGTSVP